MAILKSSMHVTSLDAGGVKLHIETIDTTAEPTYENCCDQTVSVTLVDGPQLTVAGSSLFGSEDSDVINAVSTAIGNANANIIYNETYCEGECPAFQGEGTSTVNAVTVTVQISGNYRSDLCGAFSGDWSNTIKITITYSGGTVVDSIAYNPTDAAESFGGPTTEISSGTYINLVGSLSTEITKDCYQSVVDPGTPGNPCTWDLWYINRRPWIDLCENEMQLMSGFLHPNGIWPPCRIKIHPYQGTVYY